MTSTETTFTYVSMCTGCGDMKAYDIPTDGYTQWKRGVKIQLAMPDVDKAIREFIKTQICGDCWDAMFALFGDDEEDQEVTE